jgi:hypothetical protein
VCADRIAVEQLVRMLVIDIERPALRAPGLVLVSNDGAAEHIPAP